MLSKVKKLELLALLEEKARRTHVYRYKKVFDILYGWQKDFINLTKDHISTCLCAANRIGKTFTGTYIDAIHLMGMYPDEWGGYKFEHPPMCWLLGYSGEKTRDLLQQELFGRIEEGKLAGGLVPAELIVDYKSMAGTSGALREVRVKHVNGISTCQFWSYSQGQHALMGDSVDWYHIDEEPRDQTIYPQVSIRTATGDKGNGGRGILTFTPENGRTDLLIGFMDSPSSGQAFMQKGWDDAPHLSDKIKKELLEQFPVHQREMRSKGVPMLGHGRIYDLSEDFIVCDPFEVPEHWYVINGMDFGWDHPQSQVQLIENRDTGDIYITKSWKARQVSANDAFGAVNLWINAPTAWPHDGLQHEKGRDNAVQQKSHYEKAGFNMLLSMAAWPDSFDEKGSVVKGGNSVEQGIYEIRDLMSKGKFKIFNGQPDLMEELRQYHRDEKGRIVKVRDDILDAIRYAYMMRRYAVRVGAKETKQYIPKPLRTMGR